MRVERADLALRPRSQLEILDLAVRMWARYWFGLTVSMLIGVIPCVLYNCWMLTGVNERNFEFENVYGAFILMMLESPFALAAMTLYLGQRTFSDRFSTRAALRMGLGSLPAMFLLQGLVRGVCVFITPLVLVVWIAMYFLNEIILLEQLPVRRVWSRRTAINARNIGRIAGLLVVEACVLVVGWIALVSLINAIRDLVNETIPWGIDDPVVEESFFPVPAVGRWEHQMAFWLVLAFITIFRFAAYLDCRIRREGWDVELILREQALQLQRAEAA